MRKYSMVKQVVMVVVVLLSVAMARADGEGAAAPNSDGHFPTFGLAINNPDGWTRIVEESAENVARWAILDEKTGQPKALMTILVGRSGEGLIAFAQDQVRNSGGTLAGAIAVDGERGIVVNAPGSSSVIVKHGGLFYIIGMRTVEAGHDKALAALVDSVRWQQIESPAKHLELGDAVAALGNLVKVQFPVCMRPVAGGITPTSLHLVANNITGRGEFNVTMQTATFAKDVTMEQARKNLASEWNLKFKPKDPIEWKADPKNPNCATTNLVQVDVVANGQKGLLGLQFGLVSNGSQLVLLSFTVANTPDEEMDSYEEAANEIARSIKFNPAAATAASQPAGH
jgi:hypothetical protein